VKIGLVLATQLLLAGGCFAQHPSTLFMRTMYRESNKNYFANKLPQNPKIIWVYGLKNDKGEALFAETFCDGEEGSLICTIKLDAQNNAAPSTAVMSMYHEQCHIKLWGKALQVHGHEFQSCMKDLANLDAFQDVW